MTIGKLKRYQDIIAFEEIGFDQKPRYVGFHASNLEVAEVTKEAFDEMSDITVQEGEIPNFKKTLDIEAHDELSDWNNQVNGDAKSGQIGFEIRSITINVTQVCNLKCTYCAAGGDGTYGDPVTRISIEKTIPQLKFLIAGIKPDRRFHISFVGGEPLLYPAGIQAIYDYVTEETRAKNITPIFSVVTNGTVITDEVLNMFKKTKLHVTVSLDGEKKINDVMRPTRTGASSTDLTVNGIQKLNLIKNNLGSLGISGVFNEMNQNISETYSFFNQFNPDWVEFNFAYSQASRELQQKYLEQMNIIADRAWTQGKELALRKIKVFDHYFNLLDSQQKVENHCGAGKSYLMVDAKNQLYACVWSVGKPSEVVGTGTDIDHAKLAKYQKPLIVLNNCQTCWARYLCGGGCMYIHEQHTGDKHKKDDLFCQRTRSLILTALMYYKMARVTE